MFQVQPLYDLFPEWPHHAASLIMWFSLLVDSSFCQEEQMVTEVRDRHGQVHFTYHSPEWLRKLLRRRFVPGWDRVFGIEINRSLDSDDLLHRIASCGRICGSTQALEIKTEDLTNSSAASLSRFTHLTSLGLRSEKMTNDGLVFLSKMQDLKSVYLDVDSCDDEVFLRCAQLPHLQRLFVSSKGVRGSSPLPFDKYLALRSLTMDYGQLGRGSLANLRKCHQLTKLDICHCAIAPEEFESIFSLNRLEFLRLDDTGLSDAQARRISQCRNLRTLLLHGTKITDEAAPSIAKLELLEKVGLAGTKMSDQSIGHFASMKTLKWIQLSGTSVTNEGVARLRKHRPELDVVWSSSEPNDVGQ